MAMNILVYPDAEMTAQDFAILIEALTPSGSGILYGVRSSIKSGSNNIVRVTPGWVTVRGRLIKVDEATDVTVPLATSGTKDYTIVMKVSLSAEGQVVELEAVTSIIADTPAFNETDGVARFPIAFVSVSTSKITSVTSHRLLSKQPTIRTGTTAPVNGDDSVDGDIYIQYKK